MSRVLVISPGVLPLPPVLGGAVENMITRLHPALSGAWEIEYISVRPPPQSLQQAAEWSKARFHYIESINPLADFTSDNHFELHESTKWQGYLDFCIEICRNRQPQLVHIHNEAHLIAPLRLALPNARLVLHVNDEVVTRMRHDDLDRLAQSCDLILACSNYIAGQMDSAFAAAKKTPPPIEVFYNFVDTQEYDPGSVTPEQLEQLRQRLALKGRPILLFVGRMIEQKGPHLAVRAFRRALSRHPNACMLLVGAPWYSRANDSGFVNLVRAESEAIADRVRFTGYVDHNRMPGYYLLADVVCAPSIWDDPSPFVTYEAQAMARPVIASQRGGIPEIVEDHVTGRCIDVFNTQLFSQILEDWFSSPDLCRKLGEAGRLRVQERFDLRKAQREIAAVYENLCAGRKPCLASSEQCPEPTPRRAGFRGSCWTKTENTTH